MTRIQNLLKTSLVFNSDDLIVNTMCSNYLVKIENQNYFIFISLLKDKIYQLYNEYYEKLWLNQINTKESIENILKNETDTDPEYTVAEMADSLVKTSVDFGQWAVSFLKLLPGLNKLTTDDLTDLVYDRIFLLMNIQFSSLYFNDELYFLLHDYKRFSKKWVNLLAGNGCFEARYKFCSKFQRFNLSKKELALLYPLIISTSGKKFKESWIFQVASICF